MARQSFHLGYTQLTCTVKKLFHFKREIADAKILHFDLGPKPQGLEPWSNIVIESPFDAELNATKHSFCAIRDLLAVLEPENLPLSCLRPRFSHPWGYPPQERRKPI